MLERMAGLLLRRRRRVILLAVAVALLGGAMSGTLFDRMKGGGFDNPDADSGVAAATLRDQFGQGQSNLVPGGGRARAALRPIHGATKVARLLAAVGPHYAGCEIRWALPGGTPTALIVTDDQVVAVLTVEADPSGGRVRAIYGMANPDKLTHLSQPN